MPTPTPWSDELTINLTTTGNQGGPSLVGLANGRFLVSWSDDSATTGDRSGAAIRSRVFAADGSAFGAEQVVNTTRSSDQVGDSIAVLADGRIVLVWADFSETGADRSLGAIRAQICNPDGSLTGPEILVNSVTEGNQVGAAVTALSDGRFVVVWSGSDADGAGIRAQMFTAGGARSGSEFQVNTSFANRQDAAAVTGLTGGRFVVTWLDESESAGDPSGTTVRGQVFLATGARAGGEFVIPTTTGGNQAEPALTALSDGRFVAIWTDYSQTGGDTSGAAIRARLFNADGSTAGAEFLVNEATLFGQSEPAISALSGGGFVAVWTDTSGDGGDPAPYAVKAQVFDATGAKSGTEFLVNVTTAGNQTNPVVTELADGRIAFAWMDESGTTGTEIRGRIFDPRLAGIVLTGTDKGDDFVGSKYADRLSGGAGFDRLVGSGGRDVLEGGDANDTLIGGAGSDVLRGGVGQDRLDGASQNDTMTGGGQADVFVFARGGNWDRITDFSAAVDRIDLRDFGFADFAAARDAFFREGSNLVFGIGADRLVIEDFALRQLSADDLIL